MKPDIDGMYRARILCTDGTYIVFVALSVVDLRAKLDVYYGRRLVTVDAVYKYRG